MRSVKEQTEQLVKYYHITVLRPEKTNNCYDTC